jgi:hypothetical protein
VTNILKPIDQAIFSMVSELSGRKEVNTKVASKCVLQELSQLGFGENSMCRRILIDTSVSSWRGV